MSRRLLFVLLLAILAVACTAAETSNDATVSDGAPIVEVFRSPS